MPHGCSFFTTNTTHPSSTKTTATSLLARTRRRISQHSVTSSDELSQQLTSPTTTTTTTTTTVTPTISSQLSRTRNCPSTSSSEELTRRWRTKSSCSHQTSSLLSGQRLLTMSFFLILICLPSSIYGLLPQPTNQPLSQLLLELDNPRQCGEVVPAYALLRTAVQLVNPLMAELAQFFAEHPSDYKPKLLPNCTFTREPPFPVNASMTPHVRSPAYGLQYQCSEKPDQPAQWIPTIVFPSHDPANPRQKAYLTLRLEFEIDLCQPVHCNTKCSWTVHSGLRVLAKQCCDENSTLCRTDVEHGAFFATRRHMLLLFNALCAISCICLIPVVWRERRRQHEARGWALMELFLLGASILYSILLLDWISPPEWGCCIAVWLRQIGFSIFYGSIVLKIYRNLQEYRVRKAQHVSVREKDMVKYLAAMLALTITGLLAWSVGSWGDPELWRTAWPQCLMQGWHFIWHGYEVLFLLYGMRLCYKARNSDWLERWQFTVAVCLEAVITCVANIIRYWMRNSGHSDTLFTVSFVQLQLTVSVNIVIIIAPKFYLKVSGESTRRSMTLGGHSGRAHPSLAKLRDNILNGTIDFAEVPIVDMNPEDIRAELKRVYTQLRMYKLKNLYQDNPHISKKRGGKKWSDKTGRTRRISIPNCSPQNKRIEEDEKSDLTVESAPHNVYLSTYKLQLEPNHSVRV